MVHEVCVVQVVQVVHGVQVAPVVATGGTNSVGMW